MIAIAIVTSIRNRALELIGNSGVPPAEVVTGLAEIVRGPVDVVGGGLNAVAVGAEVIPL